MTFLHGGKDVLNDLPTWGGGGGCQSSDLPTLASLSSDLPTLGVFTGEIVTMSSDLHTLDNLSGDLPPALWSDLPMLESL